MVKVFGNEDEDSLEDDSNKEDEEVSKLLLLAEPFPQLVIIKEATPVIVNNFKCFLINCPLF